MADVRSKRISREGQNALNAMRSAMHKLKIQSSRTGIGLAVWRKGRVAILHPGKKSRPAWRYAANSAKKSSMTASLENAFAKASRLPDELQNELARQLLEDIAMEKKWDRSLARSQPRLEKMARKAVESRRKGKFTPKGFDQL
jgi:hypothetical protein